MRILQVRFKNLNSLVGEWQIDLMHPAFASDGIFAITGPTLLLVHKFRFATIPSALRPWFHGHSQVILLLNDKRRRNWGSWRSRCCRKG